MSKFELVAPFQPTGDQPEAIRQLVEGIRRGEKAQTLLGVTGSGKTFTIANVIAQLNKPTLIISHNKTLAAQLYGEFKQFFPNNAVEYFISYYDYYQPEAYIATTDTYIEKELAINEEIEKLRLRATSALLSGRNDVIVVASVSCIYGMGNPDEFARSTIHLKRGQTCDMRDFLFSLVDIMYHRTEGDFVRGSFRVKGDTVDVFPAYADWAYRISFFDDEIDEISRIEPESGKKISTEEYIRIFPANLFITGKEVLDMAMREIEEDLEKQVAFLEKEGKSEEARRLKERTLFDLEMMAELGYCSGIENYSRYFDRRQPGQRPFCLLDYFPDDYLMVIDESHVTIPQIRGMYNGDRARKLSLVEHGFRLPAALDNRPLRFEEFESLIHQVIFMSATPAAYELEQSGGAVVEQVVRPTGLLDPLIEVRPTLNQIDDLLDEISMTIERGERVMITTLTKRMAEELSRYLDRIGIRARYIHSELDALERVEVLRDLRLGEFDVLVGVNLLREGLDLPEVSLVAIMDADKEGFLRDERSLIQTIGRAARNANGRVLMYADRITKSMQKAIEETNRRRAKQEAYNRERGIVPKTVLKSKEAILERSRLTGQESKEKQGYKTDKWGGHKQVAEPAHAYHSMDAAALKARIKEVQAAMEAAAKDLDFIQAAALRDELLALKEQLKKVER
ncbi:MAG: UvrABC system protein B [Thermonema sp.]|uniref:excinuclease ABC subunit UvrB n=1 Tax=Thermonema sp. TaxID=2231181 RepID=UPI0021DC8A55|nr:excinuclease ABC subunit UvrB [Thermonema sp.]GIV38989.1 MAG: UvrABC system protein B [Thermonema sp.]